MKGLVITTDVFPPDVGDSASYVRLLAEKVARVSPVAVVTYSSVIRDKDDKSLPFKVIRVWKRLPRFFRHLVYFSKVLSVAKKADAIFALNAVSAGTPALTAAKILKKKFFVKIVGDYAWEIAINKGKTQFLINDFQKTKKNGWIGVLHRLQVWVCRNSDCVIVPSAYLAGIVAGWGVPKELVKVVYNSVDMEPAGLDRQTAREKIGIPGNVILSVGRLVPWKGFKMLIKIMPQLLEINQFFRLVIVGDGPDKKILQSMVRNLGLERKVFLVGKKTHTELPVFMAAADIFVLNTGYEGFSHQILEAMMAGVPLVTTLAGGNKEVVRQGENGFMVRYNDEFNLVEAIKTTWQTPALREQFAEEGKKTAATFSVDKMYRETLGVLLGAVKK